VAADDLEAYGAMVAGLERATWLICYCSVFERLYNEHFADNDANSNENKTFVENLVALYVAILEFLIEGHHYFGVGTTSDYFSHKLCDLSHESFQSASGRPR
jgi:hypothetical protein